MATAKSIAIVAALVLVAFAIDKMTGVSGMLTAKAA